MSKTLFTAALFVVAGLAFANAPRSSSPRAPVQVSQSGAVDDFPQDPDGGSMGRGSSGTGTGTTGSDIGTTGSDTDTTGSDTDPMGSETMSPGTDTTGSDTYRGTGTTGTGQGRDAGYDPRSRSRGSTTDDALDTPPLIPERDATPGTVPPSRTSIPGAGK